MFFESWTSSLGFSPWLITNARRVGILVAVVLCYFSPQFVCQSVTQGKMSFYIQRVQDNVFVCIDA